ncbi:MAG TPA: quinone oxidoreductase [Thermoanaerobaculia bacterium]|jgi:NADPH2:quinone reductase|nr:quinone oxidoreductase [Thermoanaerobaculia bacterium]
MKAIRIDSPGGPETMRLVEVPEPKPREGEALVRIDAAGVNFIDVYHRSGAYPLSFPLVPGQEGAGTVVEVGAGVTEVSAGDRVAFASGSGAYTEIAAVSAARLVRVPDGVSTRQAAAVMLQGMTAHYLATSTYALQPGDACLVHAAAGGVGLLLCQIAKLRGARVLGTMSTEEKARLARQAGADETILYREQDFVAEVRRRTGGAGVQVVYDGVGRDTFEQGLDCLAARGTMVLFGQASGPVPPIDPQILNRKGSLYLTRPTIVHYTRTREELNERAGDVLGWVAEGKLTVRIFRELPLAQAGEAHRILESRATAGKLLLIP